MIEVDEDESTVSKATTGHPQLSWPLHVVVNINASSTRQDPTFCTTSDKRTKSTTVLKHSLTPIHSNELHQKH